jgi:F-type H+-transporting ATPase subunit c
MKKAILFALTTIASLGAFAEDAAEAAKAAELAAAAKQAVLTAAAAGPHSGLVAIAAAIAIGLAVFGGTMAQGKASSAALEGIARNPAAQEKMFTPFILALALIESLVILAFLVAFIKLPSASFGF